MGVIDVISFEGNNNVLIYKHPQSDFNLGSQLIVHESQEAVFLEMGELWSLLVPAGIHLRLKMSQD